MININNMKIYILEYHVDYEGFSIEGVFDSEEKLKAFMLNNPSIYHGHACMSTYELNGEFLKTININK